MLSVPHLIIIFLVALIVLGPEKLPQVARTLAKAMGEFREATGGLRETFEQEMRQLEREINEAGQSSRPAPPAKPVLSQANNPLGEVESKAVDAGEAAASEREHVSEPTDSEELAATAEDPFPAGSVEPAPPAVPEEEAVPEAPQPEEKSRLSAADPGKSANGHSTTAT
jgi:TatA/E family protein of Tat protein translocase